MSLFKKHTYLSLDFANVGDWSTSY